MEKVIFLIIVLFFANNVIAQDCKCQKNDYINDLKPYSLYDLGNGNKIALCGYVNGDDTFSEFVLTDCGSKTNINSWGAIENCSVELDIDTLVVREFAFLPIENEKYQIVVWEIYKYSYNDKNEIQEHKYLNPNFPKYNKNQIQEVIKQYKNSNNKLNDNTMILANKLFICVISGSKDSENYFIDFPNKFKGLDGGFLEEYQDLKNMLLEWHFASHHKP